MKFFSEKASRRTIYFGLTITVISLIMFLWKSSLFHFNQSIEADKIAQFGDFIGGVVGSLFSLTGVILFYVALKEQRIDFKNNTAALELQREELKLQRVELEETRGVFESQAEQMQEQKNDSRFFGLLENHKQVVGSFAKGGSEIIKQGKTAQNSNHREAVSGYEVLDEIAQFWRKYFELYDDAFQKKRILNLKLSEYQDCIEMMNSNTVAKLHYRELHNLYLFIQEKLNNDSFYLKTLNVNLTDNERYIFESIYNNFNQEVQGLVYRPSRYFIKEIHTNFNTDKIPLIKAQILEDWDKHDIIFHSENRLKSIELIIYSYSTNIQIEDIVHISGSTHISSNHDKFNYVTEISVNDALKASNLNIHKIPFFDGDALNGKNFIYKIVIEKNGADFDFCFKCDYRSNQINPFESITLYYLNKKDLNQINTQIYDQIIDCRKLFSNDSRKEKPELATVQRLYHSISNYFQEDNNRKTVKATDLNSIFIDDGIFREDDGKNAIDNFLNDLSEKGKIDEVPFAYQKAGWHFGKRGMPTQI